MILADTSAWIEYDRETDSPTYRRIHGLVETGGPLAVTEPVMMEFIGGTRSSTHERAARRLFARFHHLAFDTPVDFHLATRIYRRCRARGITPRGFVDCMITAVAFRNGATVLAHDLDLARICTAVGIELDEASLR